MSVRKAKSPSSDGQSRYHIDIVYTDLSGRRQRHREVVRVSKRAAQKRERELRNRLISGELVPDGSAGVQSTQSSRRQTLAEFEIVFLQTYAEANNKPAELKSKQSILKNHLRPFFGEMELSEIGVKQIEEFKAKQVGKGLKPKTVNNELTVLRKLLTVAFDWGVIERVPKVKWLKTTMPDPKFLSHLQATALVDAAEPDWRPMVQTALHSGLRLGELRGLQWTQVDFENRRLTVSKAASREILGVPKNHRMRVIEMNAILVEVLRGHRHLRGPFVFCQKDGSMLTENRCRRPLRRACDRAGIERIQWHVLRHTFASHLAMRGANVVEIKELMGHADLMMTNRYMHLSPNQRRRAVELLEVPASAADAKDNGEGSCTAT